jgi:thioredoxin reductase
MTTNQSEYDLLVVGAGPAGLSAAIEAARMGASVLVVDENSRPGGQLFKQIHKFFGSVEHMAGQRGFDIGLALLRQAQDLGIEVALDTTVFGFFEDAGVGLASDTEVATVKARATVLATGANEKSLVFPGWTLPGVMGAGAAQTHLNIWRVTPGKRVLMVGSGNVGLIVAYQIMQAGSDVVAVVEAAPRIGGYGVHASKIRRAGVPILLSTTIKQVLGDSQVEHAVTVELDAQWQPVQGTERVWDVDTVCMAVGLTPMAELSWMAGCRFEWIPELGGYVPVHDEHMKTTVDGVYVAGDLAGVEEASVALEEGRLAGISAALCLGLGDADAAEAQRAAIVHRLGELRAGAYGEGRESAKRRLLAAAQDSRDTAEVEMVLR